MNRIIWLFRETRSGSSWLTSYLCTVLNKQSIFLEENYSNKKLFEKIKILENIEQTISDYQSIIHTHVYEMTKMLHKYDNPIVLRCSRKNKFEQFLSWCGIKYSNYNFYNLQNNLTTEQMNEYKKFISKRIAVKKQDYTNWCRYEIDRINKFWPIAEKFENYTIYYEDMLEGSANIPILNLYNIKSTNEGFIIRLPESYKKDMFINYDEVKEWFNNDQY